LERRWKETGELEGRMEALVDVLTSYPAGGLLTSITRPY
jgi:hypothetical protein